jgi:hypothetical protein
MLPGDAQKSLRMEMFQQHAGPLTAGSLDDTGQGYSTMQEKRLRDLNAARQKSLVADTDKLLKLARELEDEVSRANSDSFTPAELRKVAEIERLAHSVKEKMSTSVRGIQDVPSFPFH